MISLTKLNKEQESGLILISIILVSGILMVIGVALVSATSGQYRVTRNNTFVANSLLVAEAGVEQSVKQLNNDDNFTGILPNNSFLITQNKAEVSLRQL